MVSGGSTPSRDWRRGQTFRSTTRGRRTVDEVGGQTELRSGRLRYLSSLFYRQQVTRPKTVRYAFQANLRGRPWPSAPAQPSPLHPRARARHLNTAVVPVFLRRADERAPDRCPQKLTIRGSTAAATVSAASCLADETLKRIGERSPAVSCEQSLSGQQGCRP